MLWGIIEGPGGTHVARDKDVDLGSGDVGVLVIARLARVVGAGQGFMGGREFCSMIFDSLCENGICVLE